MKCPYCGTENRPDVRFCKECGRSLDAAATGASEARTSPMNGSSSGRSCPHCGSPIKPGARFCPRCGEALSTGQPAAFPAQPSNHAEASPSPSRPQSQGPSATPAQSQPKYAQPQQQPPQSSSTQPNLPSGGPSTAYNEPQAAPPPPSGGWGVPTAISTGEQSALPPWLWIVIGVAIGIVVLIVIFFGFRLLTNGGEAAPTPTPTLEPYEAELTSRTEAEVKAGDPLSLTFTLSNIGEVEFSVENYELLGDWSYYFDPPEELEIPAPIQPQENQILTFTFQPTQSVSEGQAEIKLLVILSVNDSPPSIESIESSPVQVTIAP